MTVFMTKGFARFARKAGLASASLRAAATEVAAGEHDAELGGGVFKQRVARPGGGRSGGFRTIILFKVGGHSFFARGFARSCPTGWCRNRRSTAGSGSCQAASAGRLTMGLWLTEPRVSSVM